MKTRRCIKCSGHFLSNSGWHGSVAAPVLSVIVALFTQRPYAFRSALGLAMFALALCPTAYGAAPSATGLRAPPAANPRTTPHRPDWPVSQTVGELMQWEAQLALQQARQTESQAGHQAPHGALWPSHARPAASLGSSTAHATGLDTSDKVQLTAIYGLAPALTVELRESGRHVRFRSGQQAPVMGRSRYRLVRVKDSCAVFQRGHAIRSWCLGAVQTPMEHP